MNQAINCTQLYTGTFAGLYRPISTLYKQRIKLRFFRMLLQTEGVQSFSNLFQMPKWHIMQASVYIKGKIYFNIVNVEPTLQLKSSYQPSHFLAVQLHNSTPKSVLLPTPLLHCTAHVQLCANHCTAHVQTWHILQLRQRPKRIMQIMHFCYVWVIGILSSVVAIAPDRRIQHFILS